MVILLNKEKKPWIAQRVCCNSQAIAAVFKDSIKFDQQTRRDLKMKRITPQCLEARSSISVDVYSSALFLFSLSFPFL